MQKAFYFLAPVEVVKVTQKNLEEVAEWCGGRVAETESRNRPGRMDKYVWVPTPKGSGVSWAFPGMIVTKRLVVGSKGELKETWAVFRRDYFETNYFDTPAQAVDKTWERKARENGGHRPQVQEKAPNITVNVFARETESVEDLVAAAQETALKHIEAASQREQA